MDLAKGFRHMVRMSNSWPHTGMAIHIKHPITGQILSFKAVDVTTSMGLKLSPAWFESVMQAFTTACVYHRPDLFRGRNNVALLYSYLDDYLGGAGTSAGSLNSAIHHSLNQMAYVKEMGRWLGLKFLTTKMEAPRSHHALLGITLDLLQRQVSLKPGKASKVSALTDNILSALFWDKKSLEQLCGNTVWVSMLLPRLRSYMTPFIELTKLIPEKRGILAKGFNPSLDAEAVRALNFLRPVFALDPSVHVLRFLNLLPVHKTVIWSDASGMEIDSKNPTPGRLASMFIYPFVKASHVVFCLL